MTGDIDSRLCAPTDGRAFERRKESFGKLHVFTEIVVAEIDVSTTRRLHVANDLIHRSLAIHAVENSRNRAVFARKRTTPRSLHRIDHHAIFFNEVVTRNGKIVDIRWPCRSVTTLQFVLLDILEYLRPHLVAFTDDDRIKETFNAIGQHRREVASKHYLLPRRTKAARDIDATLQLHDLSRQR